MLIFGWVQIFKVGDVFEYTYDAVGNRLTQTINSVTTTYVYDAANRLVSVNGVSYTWDINGNLTSDGTNTYTYDYSNRLVSLTNGVDNYNYRYNGLSDRIQQNVNEVTTTYVLDLNTGLTQVLSDGTDTYLYGLDLIGEESTAWDYYLGDALGSVRQLTDGIGNVSLAQTFEPYGEVWASLGTGRSSYAYTGEAGDGYIKLIYLRSRYYAPTTGRFLTKDVWQGDYTRPLSLNGWNYVEGNPVNYTDPSGFLAEGDWREATRIYNDLLTKYYVRIHRDWGVRIIKSFSSYAQVMYPNPTLDPDLFSNDCYKWVDGNWKDLRELELIEEAVVDVAGVLGGSIHFRSAFHNRPVDISRKIEFDGAGLALPFIDIWLDNSTFPSNSERHEAFSRYTIAHELGHVWDIRENLNLSKELGFAVGTIQQRCVYISSPNTCISDYYYSPTSAIERAAGDPRRLDPRNPKDSDKYAYTTMYEDWAETFASFVYQTYWSTYRGGENLVYGGIRWTYVESQISNLP